MLVVAQGLNLGTPSLICIDIVVIYEVFSSAVAQGRMKRVPNET